MELRGCECDVASIINQTCIVPSCACWSCDYLSFSTYDAKPHSSFFSVTH